VALGLCSSCNRFARSGEACPFCGASIAPPIARARPRVSRAALALVGALATQCNCKEETIAQPYGAPPRPPVPEMDAEAPPAAPDAGVAMPKDKQ
jgi:hypothetical protein